MTDVRSTHIPLEVLLAGATSGERATHEAVEVLFGSNIPGIRTAHFPLEFLVNVPPPPSEVRVTHDPVEVLLAGARSGINVTHLPAEFLVNIPLGAIEEAITLSAVRELVFDEIATMEGLRYSLQVLLRDQLDAQGSIALAEEQQIVLFEETAAVEESISLALLLQLQLAQDIEDIEESLSLPRSETVLLSGGLIYEESTLLNHILTIGLYDEQSVALSTSYVLSVGFSEEVVAGACIIDMRWQTA